VHFPNRFQPVENKTLVPPSSSKLRINSSLTSKGIERSYEYALCPRFLKRVGRVKPAHRKSVWRNDSLERQNGRDRWDVSSPISSVLPGGKM
jgi:hypothetical protein